MNEQRLTISVVTPTFFRPNEMKGLLASLAKQSSMPFEVIVVDGAPDEEKETEELIKKVAGTFPFDIYYHRHSGGTAIQRNFGIDHAKGELVALIDDDVRLEENFLDRIAEAFENDTKREIGGITGFRKNQHFNMHDAQRWRWYKRLGLLTTYEPGKYDFKTGYPINNNMQSPFSGTREVDFMTTACTVWRSDVFDSGLRFDVFFSNFGVLEDAHFSLKAKREWVLLQCGDARCEELNSPLGRESSRLIGYKCVVNYYYVFQDIARPLSLGQKFRFWRYQAFEVFRMCSSLLRRRRASDFQEIVGRLEGVFAVTFGYAFTGNDNKN